MEFLLTLIGKALITGLTTFLFYLFITLNHDVTVQEPIYLLILVAVTSYATAVLFMSVFEVAVDTLLACYIIDEATNLSPVHAPMDLKEIMDQER